MFLKNLWDKILSLFGRKTATTDKEYTENQSYALAYQNIQDINFNAIFSTKLSNYASNESDILIDGKNKRAKYLNLKAQEIWEDRKKIFNRMLGMGGIFVIPYYANGEIQYDLIPQFRVSINEMLGKKIINMTVLADIYTEKKGYTTKIYYRWADYKIENGNEIISQRYTDENASPVEKPTIWETIEDYFMIPNVEKITCGYFKSPVDNRQTSDNYGVPITYGCESTIKEIKDTMRQIVREYKLKQVFVGADYTIFNKEDKLPDSGLFKMFDLGTNSEKNFLIYDPAFRPYWDRLEELYQRLEHQIGTSEGIISRLETKNATATEIKKALYDTFTIVTDARVNFEKGMNDLIEAINILANYYSVTPLGDYEVSYSWSYDLLESTEETWRQMNEGHSKGAVKTSEIRNWLFPKETLEESQAVIEEIKEENPSIEDLLGTKGNKPNEDE